MGAGGASTSSVSGSQPRTQRGSRVGKSRSDSARSTLARFYAGSTGWSRLIRLSIIRPGCSSNDLVRRCQPRASTLWRRRRLETVDDRIDIKAGPNLTSHRSERLRVSWFIDGLRNGRAVRRCSALGATSRSSQEQLTFRMTIVERRSMRPARALVRAMSTNGDPLQAPRCNALTACDIKTLRVAAAPVGDSRTDRGERACLVARPGR